MDEKEWGRLFTMKRIALLATVLCSGLSRGVEYKIMPTVRFTNDCPREDTTTSSYRKQRSHKPNQFNQWQEVSSDSPLLPAAQTHLLSDCPLGPLQAEPVALSQTLCYSPDPIAPSQIGGVPAPDALRILFLLVPRVVAGNRF